MKSEYCKCNSQQDIFIKTYETFIQTKLIQIYFLKHGDKVAVKIIDIRSDINDTVEKSA